MPHEKIILKLIHISIMLIVTIFVFSCCSGKTQIGDSNSEIINSPLISYILINLCYIM